MDKLPRSLFMAVLVVLGLLAGASQGQAKQAVEVTNIPLPVEVTNAVRDADNPARQSVQHKCVCQIAAGQAINTDNVTVPSGKRLVIEFVSVRGLLPTGQKPLVQIFTATAAVPSGTTSMGHVMALPVGPIAVTALTDEYHASQPVRLYSDPGSTATIHVARNQTGGDATFEVTWSGYLVDLP